MRRFYFNLYFFLMISIVLTSIGANWLMGIYFKENHEDQIRRYNQEISRGCFHLLAKELQGIPEKALPAKIKELQVHFGYPIAVRKIEDLTLTPEEIAFFRQGMVVVRDEGSLHLRLLQDSDYAMTMGPFVDFAADTKDHIIGFITVALFMAVFSLVWAFYFWRQLSMISNAARAFGNGDLTARVRTSFLSPTTAIAKVFNSMADQIEMLLCSHKELINAVSHELRTPISRIRFGLERIYSAEEQQRSEDISGMRKDINELEDLVSELLGYAKLESSRQQQQLPKGPLLPWIEELVVLARETIKVPVIFNHHGLDTSSQVSYDPKLLERALHNLLQNADRYARNLITLSLSAEAGEIRLIVEDDGPGIMEKDREKIFEPFVRLDSSRNREFGGYGLGLAIVKQIARYHHGRILVRSAESGGAVFEMIWPATDAAAAF